MEHPVFIDNSLEGLTESILYIFSALIIWLDFFDLKEGFYIVTGGMGF